MLVPPNVCRVEQLSKHGLRLDTERGRETMRKVVNDGEHARLMEKAAKAGQFGRCHYHAHELRAEVLYFCAPDTIVALDKVKMHACNEKTRSKETLLCLVDRAMVAYSTLLETLCGIAEHHRNAQL